jgi:hypothetical protein
MPFNFFFKAANPMMFIPMNLNHLTLKEEWLATLFNPMPDISAILLPQTLYVPDSLTFSDDWRL